MSLAVNSTNTFSPGWERMLSIAPSRRSSARQHVKARSRTATGASPATSRDAGVIGYGSRRSCCSEAETEQRHNIGDRGIICELSANCPLGDGKLCAPASAYPFLSRLSGFSGSILLVMLSDMSCYGPGMTIALSAGFCTSAKLCATTT